METVKANFKTSAQRAKETREIMIETQIQSNLTGNKNMAVSFVL